MPKRACGPQTELLSNDAVRVTRCACATVHVAIHASGVTLRLSAEAFRGIAAGLAGAAARLEEQPPEITSTGSTSIN